MTHKMKLATMYTLPDCIICGVVKDTLQAAGYEVIEEPLSGCADQIVTDQLAQQMNAAPVVVIDEVAVSPLDITSGRLKCQNG